MRENYRKSIASSLKLPQFTTMHVIDGQAGLIICASLIFYSLTIDNILNIIVMLILAAISISMLTGDNSILKRAVDAKERTGIAELEERIKVSYNAALAEDLTTGNGKLQEDTLRRILTSEFPGKEIDINTSGEEWVITIDGVSVNVPAGKTEIVSKLTEEEKNALQTNGITEIIGNEISNKNLKNNDRIKAVLTGNIPLTNEMTYITGTADTGIVVSIDGNEFVWVPVPDVIWDGTTTITSGAYTPMAKMQDNSTINYQGLLYDFNETGSEIITIEKITGLGTKGNREPEYLNNNSDGDASSYNTIGITQESLQKEYNSMITSIIKYKGFYVARFELGIEYDENGKISVVSKNVSKGINGQTADASYKDSKSWYGLYEKCKSMYPKSENKNVTSTMIWGSQYDAMMNWMIKTNNNIGRPDSNKYNQSPVTGLKANNGEDIINNIYDLYGCHFEWTLEAREDSMRSLRGGCYNANNDPAFRSGNMPDAEDNYRGSRTTIFIK